MGAKKHHGHNQRFVIEFSDKNGNFDAILEVLKKFDHDLLKVKIWESKSDYGLRILCSSLETMLEVTKSIDQVRFASKFE